MLGIRCERAAWLLTRHIERLGTIPRPTDMVTASLDLRRLAVRTRDFRGDVWLAHLAPAR